MKTRVVKFLLFSVLLIGGIYVLKDPAIPRFFSKPDDGIKKVFGRNAIQEEGYQLAEKGYFKEALAKYQEAIQSQYINDEYEKGTAMAAMRHIYIAMQDYDAALKCMEWVFQNSLDGKPTVYALEEKHEIEALKKYQETGNPQMVVDHIKQFRINYKNEIPPDGYGIGSNTDISTLVRLYNTIGDHDAGIKLIDECIEYFKNQDIKKYGVYKPGHADAEYLKIRAGFEQDKAEGFKGCAGKKPGEVCVGHATKALIESHYFPW